MIDAFRRYRHRAGDGSQRGNTPSVRLSLRQAPVDHAGQCRWPERLAIDDHQIERRVVEGGETVTAAIGDRDPKAVPLEPSAKREADMWIVIDNQKAVHTASPAVFHALDSTGH
jgi:hypothetical protein